VHEALHGKLVHEALHGKLETASCSHTLVLMGDFKYPHICWRNNTAGHKHSRRFLERIGDDFLLQVVEKPKRRGVLLDLIFPRKDRFVGDVKIKSSLGCSDNKMVEFGILRAGRKVKSKPLPWPSEKQALASSKICLEVYNGIRS